MIIYLESQAKNYPVVKKILDKNKKAQVIEISNYKNVFDKNIGNPTEKCLILAKLNSPAVTKAPNGYGHNGNAFFFKTSLNCIFDCSYCYLKGAFKNPFPVFFVNYDDIKKQIELKIMELKTRQALFVPKQNNDRGVVSRHACSGVVNRHACSLQVGDNESKVWFYSSDYSDIQGFDFLTDFNKEFISFFEQFPGVMMETRTKSGDVSSLLDLGFVPKNTEVAFSLNPQSLIEKYEKGTAPLDARIKAANSLLERGFKVGLRFLPLLPVDNYYEIYSDFISELKSKIDFAKLYSTFAAGLLYTKEDYNKILKKNHLDVLYRLKDSGDGFFREKRKIRDDFYRLFRELDERCMICLDE